MNEFNVDDLIKSTGSSEIDNIMDQFGITEEDLKSKESKLFIAQAQAKINIMINTTVIDLQKAQKEFDSSLHNLLHDELPVELHGQAMAEMAENADVLESTRNDLKKYNKIKKALFTFHQDEK